MLSSATLFWGQHECTSIQLTTRVQWWTYTPKWSLTPSSHSCKQSLQPIMRTSMGFRVPVVKHVHTMYKHVYVANVLCTDGYIHFMNCTDSDVPCTYIVQLCTYTDISFRRSFWFARLAGLLAGTGCCLVSHLFKFKHTSLIGISLRT